MTSMHVTVELCVVPLGVGTSLSEYITACQQVLAASGLHYEMHAYGTNIEGDWEQVFAAVRRCHEAVHALGAPRIFTTLKVGTRTDRQQSLQDKVDSVRRRLAGSAGAD